MSSPTRGIASPLIDLLFPRRCLGCGGDLEEENGGDFCAACQGKIVRITEQRCPYCGEQIGPDAPRDRHCLNCRGMPLVFRRASAPCKHDGPIRELVLGLKYGGRMAALPVLSRIVIEDLSKADFMGQVDVIVPVPLHRRQRLARGFNQSELLARRLARHFSIPVCTNRLRRMRHTTSQTKLSRSERLKNLEGAFAVVGRNPFVGKTVLLCDDVMTTGATATECARALVKAGAKMVYVSIATR